MLTQDQIDAIPGQPDGIEDDSRDIPEPARAAERILAYVEAMGDGLYDVTVGGSPLYGRDLESLVRAYKKLGTEAARSDADHRMMDARATELEAEVERLLPLADAALALHKALAEADHVGVQVQDMKVWREMEQLCAAAHDADAASQPAVQDRKLPVCADCGHRHRWGSECAGHVWSDSCPYDAGADCETAVDQPVSSSVVAVTQPAEEINNA